MPLPVISEEFLIVSEPALTFSRSGVAVANFRVKTSSRKEEPKGSGNWVDDKVLWANVTVWRDPAQHAVDSLKKDDLVVIVGRISTREFEHQGQKRTAVEIEALSIGPSLKFRTTPHGAGGAQQGQQQQPSAQQQQQYAQPQQGYAQPQQGYAQPQQGYAQPQQGYAQPQGQPQGQPVYQQPVQDDPWAAPAQQQPGF